MFFVINFVILIGYIFVLTQFQLSFLGHDEYGLAKLFLIISVISIHITAVFVFAIFKYRRLK
ncbi:hypothetical protein BC781_11090 [Sediminitomix flava]|uniref:Uncharacterized protein n=1 Tax=Sediminitomix flava TaxID=379075 RepID=A0A315YYT6_SEDFL|nr:hypothetical protein BC781_11090 [Sediminitomix flava]